MTEEKRKITQLLGSLRHLRSMIPDEALTSIDAQSISNYNRNTSSTVENTSADISGSQYEELNDFTKRRDELLAEVAKYRDLCGQLRAKLEQYNMFLSGAKGKALNENAQDSLFVARF